MILNNTTVNHLIEILDKKIALSKLVKLLGLTILTNKQNLNIHINDLGQVAIAKLKRSENDSKEAKYMAGKSAL